MNRGRGESWQGLGYQHRAQHYLKQQNIQLQNKLIYWKIKEINNNTSNGIISP